MDNCPDNIEFELICVITNFGSGSKVIKIAKKNGVLGGTIFLGKGTVKNRILELLDICDVRKEIVFMISEKNIAVKALEALNKELNFKKPNHGITFSTSVINFIRNRISEYNDIKESKGVENTMYNAIFVIVDKGKAESVMDVATKAGSRGGTILNARGSGIHETSKLFHMDIEPEKEVVLILSENHFTESIVSSIREKLQIDEPGNGVIFTLGVNKAYGLY